VVNQTDWSTFNAKQAALGYTAVNKAGDTLTGTLIAPLQDSGGQVYNILGYGAKADAKSFTNGATTAGSAVFTSATANFTSADVGKIITIAGGYTGGVYFRTTIASWQSATQVTLASAAPLGVSGASFDYGTNNSTALQAAVNAAATAGGGTILIPVGTFLMGTDMSGDLKHNIWIKGSGRGATVLKLCGGIAPIAFGTGDATLNHVTKNIRVTDLTIDMNGQTGASYGLIAACCQDVSIDKSISRTRRTGPNRCSFSGSTRAHRAPGWAATSSSRIPFLATRPARGSASCWRSRATASWSIVSSGIRRVFTTSSIMVLTMSRWPPATSTTAATASTAMGTPSSSDVISSRRR
jgi:hypothetical protein